MFWNKKNKEKKKNKVVTTSGLIHNTRKLHIQKLIINLGGIRNIKNIEHNDAGRLDITIRNPLKLKLDFFRSDPAIINFFYKDKKLGLLLGEQCIKLEKNLKKSCSIK